MAAKKPLNLLYFDGASAAKMRGPLDVQDIIVWGKVTPERMMDEYGRIYDLCRWGEKYGLDGFLRCVHGRFKYSFRPTKVDCQDVNGLVCPSPRLYRERY